MGYALLCGPAPFCGRFTNSPANVQFRSIVSLRPVADDGNRQPQGVTAAGTDYSYDLFAARIDPVTGLLEESFGNQSMTIVDFGFNLYSSSFWAGSILVQSIGKLVVAGSLGLPNSCWGTAKSGGLGLAKAEISIAATNPPRPPTAAPSSSGGGRAGVGMLVLLATMIVKRCAPLNNKRPRAGAAV